MAELKLYGKVTALSTIQKVNDKLRQIMELTDFRKEKPNVYRIVVYNENPADFNKPSELHERTVETECFLNGRRFSRQNQRDVYGMELILKSIEVK